MQASLTFVAEQEMCIVPHATRAAPRRRQSIRPVHLAQLMSAVTDPITLAPMVRPTVLADCGHSFEQSSIDALCGAATGESCCPLCRTPIVTDPVPNYLAQSVLDALLPHNQSTGKIKTHAAANARVSAHSRADDAQEGGRTRHIAFGGALATHAAIASLAMACLYVGLSTHASPHVTDKIALALALGCIVHLGYTHESARVVCCVGLLILSSAHLLALPLAPAPSIHGTSITPRATPAPTFMQVVVAFGDLYDDIRKLRGRT